MEDFLGDMDFKVTGTEDGVTAIQMDIKVHGSFKGILEKAYQTGKRRQDVHHGQDARRNRSTSF